MQLLMTWPDNQPAFPLGESYTVERAACFNPQSGQFSRSDSPDALWFYRTVGGPVMFNACPDLLCLIDGDRVAEGERRLLRLNTVIQLGHYGFTLADDETGPEEALCQMLSVPHALQSGPLATVEAILPGHRPCTDNERYLNGAVAEDMLKALAEEYKQVLVGGEQNRHSVRERPMLTRLRESDDYFEAMCEEMKAKTLTECLMQTPSLMDRVWRELNVAVTSGSQIFDNEKTDILSVLAPESRAVKEKQTLSELVLHDRCKPGLDSPF